MGIYQIDPIRDERWGSLVERHPRASVFHSVGWLRSLEQTYGYKPVAFTTSPPGSDLDDGLVACEVRSWLTGNRLVSLPFSDHCEPLADTPEQLTALLSALEDTLRRQRLKYVELRPLISTDARIQSYQGMSKGESYYFQSVDLNPDIDALFRSFHKSCVQRKIHRAEREHLEYQEGRSEELVKKFYDLMLLTRRRHGLPPQPLVWFRNLVSNLNDKIEIRLVSKDGVPVASILTILHKKTLVYKYGCSDARFHNLGGMPLLFWRAIQDAKRLGVVEYDLGRSERDNEGLISFKENWNATKTPLTYYRYPVASTTNDGPGWSTRIAKQTFARMPDSLLRMAGSILYRHIG